MSNKRYDSYVLNMFYSFHQIYKFLLLFIFFISFFFLFFPVIIILSICAAYLKNTSTHIYSMINFQSYITYKF